MKTRIENQTQIILDSIADGVFTVASEYSTIKLNNSKGLKMPIYEYRCKDCGATSEFLLGVGKDEKIFCHTCESLNIERIMSAASLVRMANARPAGNTCCGREERCEAPPCSSGGTCSRH